MFTYADNRLCSAETKIRWCVDNNKDGMSEYYNTEREFTEAQKAWQDSAPSGTWRDFIPKWVNRTMPEKGEDVITLCFTKISHKTVAKNAHHY